MKLSEETISKVATACVIALLSWNVLTTHELVAQQSVIVYKLEQMTTDKAATEARIKSLEERVTALERETDEDG